MEMERTLIDKGLPDNVLERMPLVGTFYADKMRFSNGTIHYRVATHPNNMQLGYLSPKYAQELIDGVNAQAARIERLEKALRDLVEAHYETNLEEDEKNAYAGFDGYFQEYLRQIGA